MNVREVTDDVGENAKDMIQKMEYAIKEQINRMGYRAEYVKLYDMFEMENDIPVFCFLYKDKDFVGAYFFCPSASRYVIYNTANDMEKFDVFTKLETNQKIDWIRKDFEDLTAYLFPDENDRFLQIAFFSTVFLAIHYRSRELSNNLFFVTFL